MLYFPQEITENFAVYEAKLQSIRQCSQGLETNVGGEEMATIDSTISNLESRLQRIHNRANIRTVELNETAELWEKYEHMEHYVKDWNRQAQMVLNYPFIWHSLNEVQQQLDNHQV